jgi:lipopolysaccharide export system protein LptA
MSLRIFCSFPLVFFFSLAPLTAFAQSQFKPAVTLGQGSGPIKIEADSLEVHDRDKTATFSGNVVVRRDDVTIRAARMNVIYSGTPTSQNASASSGDQVKRIEMSGRVLFVQKDQQGSGDTAVYDKVNEIMTMNGNVVLTQGQNVAKGQKLIVNMRNGQAHLEGRPHMIILPNDPNTQKLKQ